MPRARRVQVTQELVMPDRSDPDRHVDLSSLFAVPNIQALDVPIDAIQPNPFQPRQEFTAQHLEELAAGIRAHGFLGTLLARPAPGAGHGYQLAYGERRWRAARLVGLPTIPVIVRDLSNQEMLEIAITENVLRADLNPLEEAQGYRQMMDLFGYSERKLAQRVGKTRSYIQHRLRILRADAHVQQLVRERPDTLRYVAPLMAVRDARVRAALVREIREGRLVSDDIQARADELAADLGADDAGVPAPAPLDESRTRPARDRLSTATRALIGFMGRKRLPLDAETASQMLYLRELIDRYLSRWEAQDSVEAQDNGSRVSHLADQGR
jgi:ParB family chromosome partitioning protein